MNLRDHLQMYLPTFPPTISVKEQLAMALTATPSLLDGFVPNTGSSSIRPFPRRINSKKAWKMRGKRPSK